jgi:hypothetical protein
MRMPGSGKNWRKPFVVMTALAPVLPGRSGRNPGDNDDTIRHLSGRSIRVLAFGLAFLFAASRMTTRERAAGKLPLAMATFCTNGLSGKKCGVSNFFIPPRHLPASFIF